MNLENILQQVLSVAGTFNLRLVIFIFLICTIGEIGVSAPYLLETVWLLSGYHLGSGAISPSELLILWVVAQAGRQIGAAGLFYFSRLGSVPLRQFYQRRFGASLSAKLCGSSAGPWKLLRRMTYLSPFSVAVGRLFGLRLPLTLALSVQKRLKTLMAGLLLQSLVWDGIYISLGIIGGHAVMKPVEMLLYSLIGLTLLYLLTFAIRHLSLSVSKHRGN